MRLTKKTKLFRGYTRDFAITNVIGEMTYKLGQLEDLFDKYGVNDIEYLEFILAHNIPQLYTEIKDKDCKEYLIDKKGNIFSKQTKLILKQYHNNKGYVYVIINKKQKLIHRLVAKTFIDNPNNYFEINHINEIKDDNRVENLEWCSRKYNATYNKCHLRHNEWNKKPIDQYDLQGNLIKTWSYALEIEKAGIGKASNVKQCCRNVLSIHNGYVWRWHGDSFESRRLRKDYDRARNLKVKRNK